MSCGCKNGQGSNDSTKMAEAQLNRVAFTDSLFMRLILFMFSVAIVLIAMIPIILPLMFIMLFNKIVMRKDTNLTNILVGVGKKLRTSKKRVDDDDDEDYEDLDEINPDDYELVDVDVVK